MTEKFSLFQNPLSDETIAIRKNLMIASGVSIFIGITGELPSSFSLLGASFSSTQKYTIGWFILLVNLYLFIHFLVLASIEVAKWIHPLLSHHYLKKRSTESSWIR